MRGSVRIEVSAEVRKKLEAMFGVTGKTVSNALNYAGKRGETELAKKIRKAAMANGGRRMAYLPAFETAHTHNGVMTQEFDSGAKLVVDMHTGNVDVLDPRGVLRHQGENVSVRELYVLQEMAAGFSVRQNRTAR